MKELIEALQIFESYLQDGDPARRHPTNCSHDVLAVMVAPGAVTEEADRVRLDQLGFVPDPVTDCWISYRFGSA